VEFEKLSRDSDQGKRLLAKARSFKPKFRNLIFPDDFVKSKEKFDIVLLVNVLNVMPVPSERLLVLQYCYEKLRKDGYLLWYTQYGDFSQNKRCTSENVLGDGYYIGGQRKFKSFYREFSAHEIDEMLTTSGFILEKSFAVSHNQARLFRKEESNVLKDILAPSLVKKELRVRRGVAKPDKVEPKITARKSKERLQEPETLGLAYESLWIKKLKKIKPGRKEAVEYQKLLHLIFSRVFDKSLRNIKLEETMFDGRKRIDIVATNVAVTGFFEGLSSKSQIKCKYIPIECKNYTHDVTNPEFDQIGGRLYEEFGMFGFLVYRGAKDKRAVLKRCQDHLKKHEHILALDDNDIIELLTIRLNGIYEEIDDYLDSKFRALVIGKEME
jgi:hypothetical protein